MYYLIVVFPKSKTLIKGHANIIHYTEYIVCNFLVKDKNQIIIKLLSLNNVIGQNG